MIASSKPELQGLLYQCQTFTTWAGLVFNAKKCGSLCMFNEAPRLYVDHLYSPLLGMEVIPALTWDERYKYLGSPTGATRSPVDALQDLRNAILRDTGTVFGSELAEWQKLDAFRRFLFPRVTFALKVVFPGTKWCQKTDTALRTIIKRGLRLPTRTCTKYLYLSQALGGMGIPSVTDESHVSRLAQAFKFLADTRDPCLRDVAVHQLTDTVAKRARYLDPTKPDHLATFLNTSSSPGEGRAGDLQSLWSLARASLTHTEAIITLTQDSATIEASQHILTWDKCKDLYPRLREAIHTRYLRDLKRTADQGRAFEPRLLPRLSLSPRPVRTPGTLWGHRTHQRTHLGELMATPHAHPTAPWCHMDRQARTIPPTHQQSPTPLNNPPPPPWPHMDSQAKSRPHSHTTEGLTT